MLNTPNQRGYSDIYKGIIFIYLYHLNEIINVIGKFNTPLIRYSIISIGTFYFLKGIIHTNFQYKSFGLLMKLISSLFLFWTIIIILRGFPQIIEGKFNYINLKLFISGQFFLFILPVIFIIEPDEFFLRKVLKFSYYITVIYLFFTLVLFRYFSSDSSHGAELYSMIFASSASLLLLTLSYHSLKVKWVTIITILIVLFLNAIFARRNQVTYYIAAIFFTVIVNIFTQSQFIRKRKISFIIGLILATVFVVIFAIFNTNKFQLLTEKVSTGMESREGIIDEFKNDVFSNSMDFAFGRGMNGVFKAGGLATNKEDGTRGGIENGFLNHILKGGWLYLGLLILISIPAIYLGFFRSNNILTKAFAAVILIYFIDMIGFGLPILALKYLNVWIGISVCLSKKFRNYSDEYLKSIVGIK